MNATHLMSWEAAIPKKAVTSAMEAFPGVCTSSGKPSPLAAKSSTAGSFEVAFSTLAA